MKICTWSLAGRVREMTGSKCCWNNITNWGKHGWHPIDGNQQRNTKGQHSWWQKEIQIIYLHYLIFVLNVTHNSVWPSSSATCGHVPGIWNNCFIASKNLLTGLQPFLVHPHGSLSCGGCNSFVLRKRFEMSQNLLICE